MDLFTQLSLIIVIATVVAGVMKLLKQPLVIGYIVTGLIIGPLYLGLLNGHDSEILHVFSEMGVSFLLFIVGLHLSPKEVKDLGKPALAVGGIQVLLTFGLVYLIATSFLGFEAISAAYIGIALSFSSTIVVLKFLADKKDLEKLYGRMAIGILLLQDLVAALVLIAFAALASNQSGIALFAGLLLKAILLIAALSFVSVKILPRLSRFFAQTPEYLFIFSIAWGFGLAVLFNKLGFSIEIGALVAGITLSVSVYAQEISARLKSLRDFFVVMFFISLGSRIVLTGSLSIWIAVIVLALFALVLKPLIIMILMSLNKYNKKTSVLAGLSLAQISEFSLIVVFLGTNLGHIPESVFSLIALVTLFSIGGSTYLINYAEKIYPYLIPLVKPFQRKHPVSAINTLASYEVVLFGCNRVGYDFIRTFEHLGESFLAVDFDPDVVDELLVQGVNVKYGDAEDGDFLEDIGVSQAKVVISTIQDYEATQFLIGRLRDANQGQTIVLTTRSLEHALELYESGADYVLLPHFIGGQVVAQLTKNALSGAIDMKKSKVDHIRYLSERKDLGHASPFK